MLYLNNVRARRFIFPFMAFGLLLSLTALTDSASAAPTHHFKAVVTPLTAVTQNMSAQQAAQIPTCRPEPPDYPGCTPAQVRPYSIARYRAQYTGHASGYRFYVMGQARHHVFVGMSKVENAKGQRLYAAMKQRLAHKAIAKGADPNNVTVPGYKTWGGFRAHATTACPAYMAPKFPNLYCGSHWHWGVQDPPKSVDSSFDKVTRMVQRCNGMLVGGVVAGGVISFWTGPGILAGGFFGGVSGEVGCQTTTLYDWLF